jgi:hypothetical protein
MQHEHDERPIPWHLPGPESPRERAGATAVRLDADGLRVERPTGTWARELPAREGPPPPWERDDRA